MPCDVGSFVGLEALFEVVFDGFGDAFVMTAAEIGAMCGNG